MSPRSKTAAAPKAAPVLKAGAEITEHRLRNGLRVLVAERHLDPVVAVLLFYAVGAKNERDDEAGVSHFLEHMMFKGSRKYGKGEVDRVTTELGGTNNAFTSADHTGYWFELASDRWEAALEIEADRMRNLRLDPAEFEAEKAVVLEELAMGEDDPWRQLTRHIQELLFRRHPYRRPVIGYRDVLERMTPDDMRGYYERFYCPGNATLVVCGDVRSSAALRAVRKHFGDIPAGPQVSSTVEPRPPIEEPCGEARIGTTWDDAANRMCIAWPTVAVCTPDDFVLDLVSALLTTGRLSRCYRGLVIEKALATTIATHNDTRVDGGSFWLYSQCAPGVEPARLEAAIDAELERLATELVAKDELVRAKATLAAAEAYEGETVSDLAENLGEYAVDADWRTALELTQRRNAVKPKDIRDVVRRLLSRERRVIGWSLGRGEDDSRVGGSRG